MKINSNEEYDRLINGYQKEIIYSFPLINIIDIGKHAMVEKDEKFSSFETQIRYYCFLCSSALDILVTLKGLSNATTQWDNIYFMKSGCLTVYETLQTYYSYQKQMLSIIESNYPDLLREYNEANIILKELKRMLQIETKLRVIRNRSAGHFDKDFVEYYDQIQNLQKPQIIDSLELFMGFLRLVIGLVDKLADRFNKREK